MPSIKLHAPSSLNNCSYCGNIRIYGGSIPLMNVPNISTKLRLLEAVKNIKFTKILFHGF